MSGDFDQVRTAALTNVVLRWWPGVARDLPWRSTRDPWAVLVSEVMAQQTQVDRVVPKWHAFLAQFPTVRDAAAAPASELIELWDGLGYNRRALLLHRCARVVVDDHAGIFPSQLDALMALPGIGPYTARAVLAFAFERDVAVVDTNVGRVLARLSGATLTPAQAQSLADELVPEGGGWGWNQALLDFGASICTKRSPSCSSCPVHDLCAWSGLGHDPALGSAAVGVRQSRFEGSDRQYRGRLVTALRRGSLPRQDAPEVMMLSDDPLRAERIIAGLVSDGLVTESGPDLRLPR